MLATHELALVAARAFIRLDARDRERLTWDMIPRVVRTFEDKRTRVKDVGAAIKYALKDHYIDRKSQEVFSSWARLLRKIEFEIGLSAETKKFAPIREEEIVAAMDKLRNDERYADLVPAPDKLYVDLFTARRIAKEVDEARMPASKLMFLTGTKVRESVPDTTKERQRLGQAYKSLFHHVLEARKGWNRTRASVKQTQHPMAPEPQGRLI